MRNNMDNPVNRKAVLFVTTLASFLIPFMGSSINIALPWIGKEFSMNAVLLSWVSISYLLSAAMFLVPLGKIADIYGRKKIFEYGMLIYTLSSFLSGISNSTEFLICSRILQGIAGSMIFGTGTAILSSVFPLGERGKVFGINVSAVYLGLSLGPILGGFLTQNFGWRSIFFTNSFMSLIVIPVIFLKLKGEWAEAEGEKFDVVGSIIYSLMLVAIMYGLSRLPAMEGVWAVLSGIIGAITFVVWEIKVENPALNMNLFRNNRVFALSNIAALINYSATAAVGFLLSLYLQYIKKINPEDAGLILMFQPIMMTILSPFAGRASDKINPGVVASIGMTVTVIGLLFLAFLNENTALGYIIASLILLGVGFGFFSSPNTNAVMSSVEKKFLGVASATLGTMRLIGQLTSMGITTLIFALYIGRVEITPAHYPSFLTSVRITFITFVIFCFVGIFASLARTRS